MINQDRFPFDQFNNIDTSKADYEALGFTDISVKFTSISGDYGVEVESSFNNVGYEATASARIIYATTGVLLKYSTETDMSSTNKLKFEIERSRRSRICRSGIPAIAIWDGYLCDRGDNSPPKAINGIKSTTVFYLFVNSPSFPSYITYLNVLLTE